jgi:hypothetical protein
MPPRRISQRLSQPGDEALQPAFAQNQPPTQNLSTIIEGLEHATFSDIPEVELQNPTNNNVSTIAAGSSQNTRGASSTQTNGGAPHQSPPWAPSPIHVIQENAKFENLQVEDWENEASEDEAAEEVELARVQ